MVFESDRERFNPFPVERPRHNPFPVERPRFDPHSGASTASDAVRFVSRSRPDHLGPEFRDEMANVVFGRADRTQGGVDEARNAALEAALADIEGQYRSAVAGSGGVSAAHRQAIAEAAELLADVKGNREAISETYDSFLSFLEPHQEAAAEAAGEVVDRAAPVFEEMAAERAEGIQADYGQADQLVSDVAELIGAGAEAEAAAKDLIIGEDMALDHAAAEAAEIMTMMEMEQEVLSTGAEATTASTKGKTGRRAAETDAQFASMQDQAEKRLAQARAAAAAAAAAARRRRAAARANRNAALDAAREQFGGLDPIEAGQFGALSYLRDNGRGIPADRQQFIQGRTMEAIENFVAPNPSAVRRVFADQGVSRSEANLIAGAIDAFGDTRDHEQARIRHRSNTDALRSRPEVRR